MRIYQQDSDDLIGSLTGSLRYHEQEALLTVFILDFATKNCLDRYNDR